MKKQIQKEKKKKNVIKIDKLNKQQIQMSKKIQT